uniref:Uncharacterized protein n=1 Tax=Coturnix japonica TaxID=93934 RepID=A0A8C2STJ3_COTJA
GGCGCPVLGGVQGQVGRGPGQPDLVNVYVWWPCQAGGWNYVILESYWLDLWLFVLFDVALFVFIYLLP